MDPGSHNLTTFQTPLGALWIVSLPMGFTNSPAEFQACMMFILKDEVCDQKAGVFIDDIPINGPESQYLDELGNPAILPENPQIRKFIWEHLTLGARGVLPDRQSESFLRVFKQFTPILPSR
jgi:hypothetical protein